VSLSRDERLLDAALAYGEQGLAIFPLHNPLSNGSCSCGDSGCGTSAGKHPRTYNGLKAATTDREQISNWWSTWADANIGIPTGAINDIVIIDVDGAEGEASLLRMTEKYGPPPATRKVRTGRGYQLYFKHPGGKVKSKAPLCAEYPHVDSRGDGGYVVAPPSMHYSGVRYTVDPTMPPALADLPAWLLDLINGDRKVQATQSVAAVNDSIPDGSRNATLTSLAGSMRARGMQQEAIEAALLVTNAQQCNPPLSDDEVRAIACSISNYAPGSPNHVLRTLNDSGNAERFAKQWGEDVRYVPEIGRWLIWADHYWRIDATGAVMEMAKRTAFDIYTEGDYVTDSNIRDRIAQHSKISQQAPRLEAMIKLAKSLPALVLPIAKLDADPWLLGVANGALDLRRGELRFAKREDYITRTSPVAFDAAATCPVFEGFVDQIMGRDKSLDQYLQRVVGYALTGDTSAQCVFFLYGTGANGKSTLLQVCKSILGADLCRQTPSETIMARSKNSGPTPELACLRGARAVMTSEVDEGSMISESLVKNMTGGEPIPARELYCPPFEFIPWFKLFVAGNHKPHIRGADEGIWRRIHMIPFAVTIPPEARDPRLSDKLRGELPGILNWGIAGCLQWQQRGLDPPHAVLDAIAEYKEDMDLLGQWLDEHCEVGADFTVSGGDAYFSYKMWAERSGMKPWTGPTFGRRLKERFDAKRHSSGIRYFGFRITNLCTIEKAKVPTPGAV
jgi:putative DNA primase/helicase